MVARACLRVRLRALKEGFTRLRASWGPLQAEISIMAYTPLHVVAPNNSALVTFGASTVSRERENHHRRGPVFFALLSRPPPPPPPSSSSSQLFVFEGGPLPWPEAPQSFRQVLNSSDTAASRILHEGLPPRAYRVVCAAISKQQLTLTVGNDRSATLPFPRQEQASVTLFCEHPHTILLEPFLLPSYRPVDTDADDCNSRRVLPNSQQTVHHVLAERTIVLNIDLLNAQGRHFDNFSTVVFQWSKDMDDSFLAFRNTPFQGITVAPSAGQMCDLGSKAALITVDVNVTGYRTEEVLAPRLPAAPPLESRVQQRTLFELMYQHSVAPQRITLLNHPDIHAFLKILNGSGVFLARTCWRSKQTE